MSSNLSQMRAKYRDLRSRNLCVKCHVPITDGKAQCPGCRSLYSKRDRVTPITDEMRANFKGPDAHLLEDEDNRRAIVKALKEGRVTGEHACKMCGLRHFKPEPAEECCK